VPLPSHEEGERAAEADVRLDVLEELWEVFIQQADRLPAGDRRVTIFCQGLIASAESAAFRKRVTFPFSECAPGRKA
jgi:hypothetical protein